MIAHQPAHTQVSPETNLTIAERCADRAFHGFLESAYRKWWQHAREVKQLGPYDTSRAIIREICDGSPSETHPEYRSLLAAFERAQVADEHRKGKS